MILTREQARNMGNGGNSFFKLGEGKSAMVRFLYNVLDDMVPMACHSCRIPGRQYPVDVLCARETQDSPISDCIYCSEGSNIVARYLIPIYNEDAQEIQYWVRSGKFEKKLTAHVEDINGKAPIAGQVFKIIRTGSGTDTDYELIKTGENDGKTKDSFGKIKDNSELHMIKEGNYKAVENNVPNGFNNNYNNQGFNNNNSNNNVFNNQVPNQNAFGNNPNFTSTRRTSNMF